MYEMSVVDQLILWAIGTWIVITTAVFGHLYATIAHVRSQTEAAVNAQFERLWKSMDDLHSAIEADRRATSDTRITMASTLATKSEMSAGLTEVLNRVVHEIDIRLPPKPKDRSDE